MDLAEVRPLSDFICRIGCLHLLKAHMEITLPSHKRFTLKPLTTFFMLPHPFFLLPQHGLSTPQQFSHFVMLSPCWCCNFNTAVYTHTLAHSFSRLSVAAEHALTVASTGTFRLKHTHINLQSSDKVCWGWEVSLYEGVFKMFSYMFAPILAAVQEMAPHIHPVIIHAASTLSLNICVPIFVHLLSPLNNSDSTQKQSLKISKLTYSTWIWPLTYKNNQLLSFGSNVSLCFLC